jgi:hypothetical protein
VIYTLLHNLSLTLSDAWRCPFFSLTLKNSEFFSEQEEGVLIYQRPILCEHTTLELFTRVRRVLKCSQIYAKDNSYVLQHSNLEEILTAEYTSAFSNDEVNELREFS